MPQNTGEVHAENTLSKLIAAHTGMRIAIDQSDDDDEIDRISDTMAAIEAEIALRVPQTNQDAISQLEWVVASEGLLASVRRCALDSLLVWARALD